LTVWAIGPTEATNRPTQGFLRDCPNPSRPHFPRKLQVGHKLDASWTQVGRKSASYPEAIPKLSRKYFIASPLAAAPSQPDRRQEVMPAEVSKSDVTC